MLGIMCFCWVFYVWVYADPNSMHYFSREDKINLKLTDHDHHTKNSY